MPIPFHFDVTGLEALEFTVREQREVVKAAMTAGATYWYETMVPRHFKKGAARRYGYKPRTQKWQKRKKALAERMPGKVLEGGETDLVFTGTMRELFEDKAFIQAYPTRVTVRIVGPRYLTMNPKGNHPNMAEEATRILPREMQFITERISRVATQEIQKIQKRKATKKQRIA